MTLSPGSRRGFLTGGLALLAMPAVVKAEGLMKVAPTSVILPEYKFDRRVLVDYDIGTDSMILRVDVVRDRKLIRPPNVREVSIEYAKTKFGADHPIFEVQPAPGQQKYAMAALGGWNGAEYTKWQAAFSEPADRLVMGVREFGS